MASGASVMPSSSECRQPKTMSNWSSPASLAKSSTLIAGKRSSSVAAGAAAMPAPPARAQARARLL
eukprot:4117316-Lingulodinium_polyedra.AAC.1